jgi:hypothetical protein
MYCGEITSRNSLPAGRPEAVDVDQQLARDAQALVDAEAFVQVRVVDQALPADRGARLLEVHAHHDFQRVGVLLARSPSACGRSPAPPGSWMEHGPMTTSSRSSLPCHDVVDALRVADQRLDGVPRIGKKRIRCSGGGSTVMSLMRSSSVWLVFSTVAYQRVAGGGGFGIHRWAPDLESVNSGFDIKIDGQKKTAGGTGGFWRFGAFYGYAFTSLRRKRENQK